VEWLFPAEEADMRIRLINADGTEAEISGNGTRCVAAYLLNSGHTGKLAIQTGAGTKHCELASRDGNRFEFEMDMGEPQVGDDFAVPTATGRVQGTPVSMGNPHFVAFVKDFPAAWQAEAAEIGRHPDFKLGVNVEFVRVTSHNDIEVRFYERGVGETQSSGTGSCASAVAAIAAARVNSPVNVRAPGGAQVVRWSGGKGRHYRASQQFQPRRVCRGL
jgi:diaminopimelate epimerase